MEEDFGEPFSEGDIIGCYAVRNTFLSLSSSVHSLKIRCLVCFLSDEALVLVELEDISYL